MPRDHRGDAGKLHVAGNRTAGASLLAGRQERSSSRVALLIVIALAELSIVALPALARVPPRPATAITETRLRDAPEREAEPLLRLPEGAIVTVRGKAEKGWYRAHDGQLEGYVLTGDVATEPVSATTEAQSGEPLDEPNVVALEQRARGRDAAPDSGRNQDGPRGGSGEIVTAADLNLRQGPSQDTPVTTVIPRGERVVPTGQHSNGFVEVRWQDATGWASGKHLAARLRVTARSHRDATSWGRRELKAIIYDAADHYGQPREDMLRVARCESNLVPTAVNKSGGSYGLFQFKPGTWRGTPFAAYDIFDPRASANAAAWMWSQGRRREWVCQ